MKTVKDFELRYALSLDISSLVAGATEEEAIEALKSMSTEDIIDLLSNSSIKDHGISDISVTRVDGADVYLKVNVTNIQFYQMSQDNLKKEPESETLNINVYEPSDDISDEDIYREIEDRLYDIYGDYPRDFDYEVVETL